MTAVLLHGYMGSAEDWNAVASGLSEECRCVAVDLPAHGRTTFTPAAEGLPRHLRLLLR